MLLEQSTTPKVTKEYAKYQDHPNGDKDCDDCTMWRNGFCSYVEGKISSEGYCRFFKRGKPEEANEMANAMGASSSIQGTGAISTFDPGLTAGRLLKRHKLKAFRVVTK